MDYLLVIELHGIWLSSGFTKQFGDFPVRKLSQQTRGHSIWYDLIPNHLDWPKLSETSFLVFAIFYGQSPANQQKMTYIPCFVGYQRLTMLLSMP